MQIKFPNIIRAGKYKFNIIYLPAQEVQKIGRDKNIWGLFDSDKRTIWISNNISLDHKSAIFIHELFHMACWAEDILPHHLKRCKNPEESIITRSTWMFWDIIKQIL